MSDNLNSAVLVAFIVAAAVYTVYNRAKRNIIRDCNPTVEVAEVMEDKSLSFVIKWHRTCRPRNITTKRKEIT